jgi:hypothetical protein
LTDFFDASREIPCGFFLITRSSALAKSSESLDAFVDMPLKRATLSEPFTEPCSSSFRHSCPSFLGAGRPLRRQYDSAQASSSSRSKAMARLPIGIVVIAGRTSELKLFLFIPKYSAAF